MEIIVKYSENQYLNDKILLLANCFYEASFDIVSEAYFTKNQNNEFIYLAEISSTCEIIVNGKASFYSSFFKIDGIKMQKYIEKNGYLKQ